jgi:hypothetical protein
LSQVISGTILFIASKQEKGGQTLDNNRDAANANHIGKRHYRRDEPRFGTTHPGHRSAKNSLAKIVIKAQVAVFGRSSSTLVIDDRGVSHV